jgi:Bacterial self-protective colicin-like immunity
VTAGDWRALIDAYLDGRLSAEAFARRFMESWRAQRDARQLPIPAAIETLFFTVEEFDGEAQMAGEEGAINDDALRQAAQNARRDLSDEPHVSPHTFDRTRAREDMRRFQVQMNGCAGAGCIIALIWIALCVLQINYVIDWVHNNWIDNVWLSAVVGFVLAFVPFIGNVLAFLGATAAGWATWLAAIVFFAAPAATILSGWSRYRRFGPPRG